MRYSLVAAEEIGHGNPIHEIEQSKSIGLSFHIAKDEPIVIVEEEIDPSNTILEIDQPEVIDPFL